MWAPRRQRPTAPSDRHDAWRSVDGIVRPTTADTWWCLLPSMHTEAMAAALAACARDAGIDATHRAVLVWDGAGGHTAADLVVPEGIHLVPVPPSSPELHPAERRWPLIDEAIATRGVADLDALEAVLVPRCQTLREQQDTIRARTCSHWWPSDIAPVIRTCAPGFGFRQTPITSS